MARLHLVHKSVHLNLVQAYLYCTLVCSANTPFVFQVMRPWREKLESKCLHGGTRGGGGGRICLNYWDFRCLTRLALALWDYSSWIMRPHFCERIIVCAYCAWETKGETARAMRLRGA